MSKSDKLMLWGAAAVMIAVGALSLRKVSQAPSIDPEIATLKIEHQNLINGPRHHPGPGPVPSVHLGFVDVIPMPRATQSEADLFRTRAIGTPVPHPDVKVYILSLAMPKTAVSTLDSTTITWSLIEPGAELKYWMKPRIESKPTGFIIKRQGENEEPRVVAEVGPKEFSYTDLATQPRQSYRYWVVAKGKESDLALDPPPLRDVVQESTQSVTTRTPTDTRAKLIGGDKDNAILRIDTYDRATKKWIGKTARAVPGQKVGSSGWTLKGLRFDNFTLVADVTDDEGVDRVLTTKD